MIFVKNFISFLFQIKSQIRVELSTTRVLDQGFNHEPEPQVDGQLQLIRINSSTVTSEFKMAFLLPTLFLSSLISSVYANITKLIVYYSLKNPIPTGCASYSVIRICWSLVSHQKLGAIPFTIRRRWWHALRENHQNDVIPSCQIDFLNFLILFYRQFDQSRGGLIWWKNAKNFRWGRWKGIQCHCGPFKSKSTPLLYFGCCCARFGWPFQKILLEVAKERLESCLWLYSLSSSSFPTKSLTTSGQRGNAAAAAAAKWFTGASGCDPGPTNPCTNRWGKFVFLFKKKNFINIFFTAATGGTGRGSNANSHSLRIFERSGATYGWMEETCPRPSSLANFPLKTRSVLPIYCNPVSRERTGEARAPTVPYPPTTLIITLMSCLSFLFSCLPHCFFLVSAFVFLVSFISITKFSLNNKEKRKKKAFLVQSRYRGWRAEMFVSFVFWRKRLHFLFSFLHPEVSNKLSRLLRCKSRCAGASPNVFLSLHFLGVDVSIFTRRYQS